LEGGTQQEQKSKRAKKKSPEKGVWAVLREDRGRAPISRGKGPNYEAQDVKILEQKLLSKEIT